MLNDVELKLATNKNALSIYMMRNEKSTRENSVNSKRIKLIEHLKWYIKAQKNEKIKIYVVCKKSKIIGYCRLNICGDVGTISYCIKRKYRNNNYGSVSLELLEKKAENVKEFNAVVKKNNIPSIKVFRKLGYTEKEENDFLEFYKVL